MAAEVLDKDVVDRWLETHSEWSLRGKKEICREVEAPSFPEAIELVRRVAEVAEARDHHPDIDIRWRTVTFVQSTHAAGGLTYLDLDLAATIDGIVRELVPSN